MQLKDVSEKLKDTKKVIFNQLLDLNALFKGPRLNLRCSIYSKSKRK